MNRLLTIAFNLVAAGAFLLAAQPSTAQQTIAATLGTDAPGGGVDGVAVWVNPADADKSTVIGAQPGAGLVVFGMDGKLIQKVAFADHGAGEVDVRYDFPLRGGPISLVAGGVKQGQPGGKIFAYSVDPTSGKLSDVLSASAPATKVAPYGSCLYHDATNAKYYLFVTSKQGDIEQFELMDDGNGRVGATSLNVIHHRKGTNFVLEACAVDDDNGWLFVAQENENNLWRYDAAPAAPGAPVLVANAQLKPGDNLEGLAVYRGSDGSGYLLASLQGSWAYQVYDRKAPHPLRGTFKLTRAADAGPVESHDCIEAISLSVGPSFPNGLFVVQSSTAQPHFELADWRGIDAALGLSTGTPPAK